MTEKGHGGGCLCGRYRFWIEGPLLPVIHCHCAMCRKATGNAVSSWTGAPAKQFHWQGDEPPHFGSGVTTRRGFCPDCGTSLTFDDESAAEWQLVAVGTLDEAEGLERGYHIWSSSRLTWIDLDNDLPKYAEDRPR